MPIEFDDLEAVDSECWTVFYGELAANQEANAPTAELFDDGTRARFDVSFTPTPRTTSVRSGGARSSRRRWSPAWTRPGSTSC